MSIPQTQQFWDALFNRDIYGVKSYIDAGHDVNIRSGMYYFDNSRTQRFDNDTNTFVQITNPETYYAYVNVTPLYAIFIKDKYSPNVVELFQLLLDNGASICNDKLRYICAYKSDYPDIFDIILNKEWTTDEYVQLFHGFTHDGLNNIDDSFGVFVQKMIDNNVNFDFKFPRGHSGHIFTNPVCYMIYHYIDIDICCQIVEKRLVSNGSIMNVITYTLDHIYYTKSSQYMLVLFENLMKQNCPGDYNELFSDPIFYKYMDFETQKKVGYIIINSKIDFDQKFLYNLYQFLTNENQYFVTEQFFKNYNIVDDFRIQYLKSTLQMNKPLYVELLLDNIEFDSDFIRLESFQILESLRGTDIGGTGVWTRTLPDSLIDRVLNLGIDMNSTNANGETILFDASVNFKLFCKFIRYGADPNVKNKNGDTALMVHVRKYNSKYYNSNKSKKSNDYIQRLIQCTNILSENNNNETIYTIAMEMSDGKLKKQCMKKINEKIEECLQPLKSKISQYPMVLIKNYITGRSDSR